jgi:inorganic triphosphatase YgiF
MRDAEAGEIVVAEPAPPPNQVPTAEREIELKFLASEATFRAMEQSPLFGTRSSTRGRRLLSTYFDTEAGDLRRQRMALRVRQARSGSLQTLKWEDGNPVSRFQRGEMEVPTPSSVPDLALFGEDLARTLHRSLQDRPLRPSFSTDIRRVTRKAMAGGSEIEAAFDTGTIIAGSRRQAVREVELELKSGDPADLYQFGLTVASSFPIRLGVLSKADRGVALATEAAAASVRARQPALAGQTVDEVLGAIIAACIDHFIANWPAFEGGDQEEAVHQMRVALRRLRSALALFHRAFPCPEFVTLRAEAKRLASAMGEARNWDVFAALLQAGPMAAFPDEAGFEAVMAAAADRRKAGYSHVAGVIADPATTRFVLAAQAFVVRRGWRNALAVPDLARLAEPASHFAASSLRRLHKRVRKRGRHLMTLPAEERHEVRIALKNLRYAADFFGVLFDAEAKVRDYARQGSHLQDVLGAFNDTVMVADLVRQLPSDGADAARAVGLVLGWYGHAERTQDGSLQRAWKSFKAARPFWPDPKDLEAQTTA